MTVSVKRLDFSDFRLRNFSGVEDFSGMKRPLVDSSSDGAGDEKPPFIESETKTETSPKTKKASPGFICDIIIDHELNESDARLSNLTRTIVKAGYYSKANLKELSIVDYVVLPQTNIRSSVITDKYVTTVTSSNTGYTLTSSYNLTVSKPLTYSRGTVHSSADSYEDAVSYTSEKAANYGSEQYFSSDYSMEMPGLYRRIEELQPSEAKTLTREFFSYKPVESRPEIIYHPQVSDDYKHSTEIRQDPIVTTPYDNLSIDVKPEIISHPLNSDDYNSSKEGSQDTGITTLYDNRPLEDIVEKARSNVIVPEVELDYTLKNLLSDTENRADDYVASKDHPLDAKPIVQEFVDNKSISDIISLDETSLARLETESLRPPYNIEAKISAHNDYEPEAKDERRIFNNEEQRYSQKCESVSNCFNDILDWMDGKKVNLSDEKIESLSQCYAAEISKIKKAREYLKTKNDSYDAKTVSWMKDSTKKLTALEEPGFYLAEEVKVEVSISDRYMISAENVKTGKIEGVKVKSNSVYAVLDRHLKENGLHGVFRVDSYIDTDTGKERQGLYLKTIAEYHLEAEKLLGGKDKYGMDLNGIIVLVNGKEPGQGTEALDPFQVKRGDVLSVVYKNDAAMYKADGPSMKKAA